MAQSELVDGQLYEYWTLVQSVRTATGPRQQIVATLGKLPGLDTQAHAGWNDLDSLLEGSSKDTAAFVAGTFLILLPTAC